MNNEASNIFEYDGYLAGKTAICKQPYSNTDSRKIKNWKADIIVTTTNTEEFGAYDFAMKIPNRSLHWQHAAVNDFDVPNNSFDEIFLRLLNILNQNGPILVHCKAGQGRSKMMAMRLLVEQGEKPNKTLRWIQKIRPLAIETEAQKIWASKVI